MSVQAAVVPPIPPRLLVASGNPSFRSRFVSPDGTDGSVEEAFSGAHALSKLNSLSFDSLILDRQLPDLNVHEVADLVRRRFPAGEGHHRGLRRKKKSPCRPRRNRLPAAWPRACRRSVLRRHSRSPSRRSRFRPWWARGRAMQHVYQLARLVAGARHHRADHRRNGHGKRTRRPRHS